VIDKLADEPVANLVKTLRKALKTNSSLSSLNLRGDEKWVHECYENATTKLYRI